MFTRDSKSESRTPEEELVFRLWCEYYHHCDSRLAEICTTCDTEGKPTPSTDAEKHSCARCLYSNQSFVKDLADMAGIDIYTVSGGKLEAKQAAVLKTAEYQKVITEGIVDMVIQPFRYGT